MKRSGVSVELFWKALLNHDVFEACLKAKLITTGGQTGWEQWSKRQTCWGQHVTKPVYSPQTQQPVCNLTPEAFMRTTCWLCKSSALLWTHLCQKQTPTEEKPGRLHSEDQRKTVISRQLVSTHQYEGETMFKAVMCILGLTWCLTAVSSAQNTDLSSFPKQAKWRVTTHEHTLTIMMLLYSKQECKQVWVSGCFPSAAVTEVSCSTVLHLITPKCFRCFFDWCLTHSIVSSQQR